MNLAAAVLTFREGLEAALIIVIIFGYLKKVGRGDRWLPVWAGALSAAGLAILFSVTLQVIGAQFDYPAKGIYEGVTSLLAVGMLSYMIYWMSRQARYIKGSLEQSIRESFAKGASWGLFTVAFVTVAREGVETALFLSASAFQTSGTATVVGGIVGIAASILVGWAVYVVGVRLNMKAFFKFTSVLLLVFGAAILRYAIHEFEEVNWLPPLVAQVWDTGQWLPAGSTLGSILQALVGYTSKPSLLQLIGYVSYLLIMGFLVFGPSRKAHTPAPVPGTASVQDEVILEKSEPHAVPVEISGAR